MNVNLSALSDYFKYPDKVAELKVRLYKILLDKNVDVSAGESLNSLIEKVKQVEGNIPENTIYITENNTETGYDVTNYTKAIVDVQASAVENDLDKLLNNTIESCVIPQSINWLGPYKFYQCTNLEELQGNTLFEVPAYAFYGCSNLKSINLPYVRKIKTNAFAGCTRLTEMQVPELTHVEGGFLTQASNLSYFDAPNLISWSGASTGTVTGASKLSYINLPALTIPVYSLFQGISNVESINLPNILFLSSYALAGTGNQKLSQLSLPILLSTSNDAISGFHALTSVESPLLTTVGGITYCYSLAEVSVPLAREILSRAFIYCSALQRIELPYFTGPSWQQYAASDLFSGCNSLSEFNAPYAFSFYSPYSVFVNCSSLQSLNLPRLYYGGFSNGAFFNTPLSLISVPNYYSWQANSAYYNCFMNKPNLIELNISRASTLISYMFLNDTKLRSITAINASIIASSCFQGCENLSEFYFTGTSIQSYAFSGTKLESLYILNGSTTLVSLATTAFFDSPMSDSSILGNYGTIYVPSSLYSNYINATEWSSYSNIIQSLPSSIEENYFLAYAKNSTFATLAEKENATTILPSAFQGTAITNLNLPEVTNIENSAFYNCTALSQISLEKVEHIAHSAFRDCVGLKSLYAPKLKETGVLTFYGCTNLSAVDLPELEIVGASAFSNCSKLSTVNLPSAKVIERQAFQFCTTLSSISLPEVELIDYSAFFSNYALSAISLPKAKVIGSSAFFNCSSITSAYLPEVELIEQYAFHSCFRLSSIFAPKLKIASMGAFYYCSGLTSLSLPELKVTSGTFSNMINLREAYIPEARIIGAYTFAGDNRLSSVYAGKAIAIGYGAFQNCSSLVSIEISQVKSIGMSAFLYCSSLVSLSLPQVRAIESSAFYYCTKLEDLYAPNLVTLSDYAFAYCSKLPEIPNSSIILSIPTGAFSYCRALTEINLPACSSIGAQAFTNCSGVSQVSIPLVSYIGQAAFYSMSGITEISNSLITVLYSNTFAYCSSLETIDMPRVESISDGVFRSCGALSNLNIKFSNLTSIPNYAFADCSNLDIFDNSEYWQNISSVGEGAFSGCTHLTQLINPSQAVISNYTYKGTNISDLTNNYIRSVGISAFASNSSLENVDLPNCSYVGSSAFQSCPNLSNINLSSSLSYVGVYAFDTTSISEITSNVHEYIERLSYVPSGLYRKTNLTSISFEFIESIYVSAFESCSLLNHIDISTVKYIYGGAFSDCSQLTEINLPNITSLGTYAFANCTSLSDITLPLDLGNISWYGGVFSGCTQISYFNCQNMTTLPTMTFAGCSNLVSINMENIKYFSANALNSCPRLTSVYLPYCSSVSIPAGTTWSENVSLENIYMPLTTYITDGMNLRYLPNLREVTCPNTYLNRGNFIGCSALESIYLLTSYSYLFSNINQASWANTPITDSTYLGYYGSFYVPSAFYSQMRANYGQYSGRWIVDRIASFPESMERKYLFGAELYNKSEIPEHKLEAQYFLGSLSASSCSLTQLSLSKLKYISPYALYQCNGITEVNLPEVRIIPQYAFAFCTNISSLNISKVEEIGDAAFQRCSGLTELNLGDVKSIGTYAFSQCYSLNTVSINTIYSIGAYAFQYCSKLKSITLNEINSLGGYAFAYCYSLSEVTINPRNYAYINGQVFLECSGLQKVTINLPEKGLTNNNQYTFAGCYHIEDFTLTGSNPGLSLSYFLAGTSISNFYANDIVSSNTAYWMCWDAKIKYIEMKNLDAVPIYMFSGNSSLITAKLDNASIIGYSTFTNCTNLQYIEFPNVTVLSNSNNWNGNYVLSTFYNCQKLSVLVFGASQSVNFSGTFNGFLNNTPLYTSTYLGYFGSIYVRKSLIGKYIADSRWATYSSRFTAIEDHLPLLHGLGLCLSFTE